MPALPASGQYNDDVDEILKYAQAGVPVMPLHSWRSGRCTCRRPDCSSPAKHPLTEHGKDDATTDLGTISEWFARWPGCNWGLRPPLGVLVLDIDPRNDGEKSLADLEQRRGALPRTLTARTGSGGQHLWFTYNGPSRGKLAPGIDIKTNGGYLVAPPSVHACGGKYEWLIKAKASYLPDWVKEILNPPIRTRPASIGGAARIDPLIKFVAGGQPHTDRNSRLFWAANRALDSGLDPYLLLDTAVEVGLSEMESIATIRSAEQTPRAEQVRRVHPATTAHLWKGVGGR